MKKENAQILIIDDDADVLISLKLLLKQHYSEIITKESPKEINQLISKTEFDLIILDMNYRVGFNDGKEGIYWLKHILEIKPDTVIILMTAYGEVQLAVNAIKAGAFDFILKPWENEKLLATIRAGLQLNNSKKKIKSLTSVNTELKKELNKQKNFVTGNSISMKTLLEKVEKVSKTDANVLILGENGIGKQHIAREIHRLSEKREGPFIHVDLGSIPESLFESELFGHKKGAFTDAKEDKKGKFELANGGSIFLDEIGNLPINLQAKLLTIIQNQSISRIGDNIEIQLNARMLFATNAPLNKWVDEGKFRQDLLYRINTIEIEIPSLRERPEDIPQFIGHFLNLFKDKYKKPLLDISKRALESLMNHEWPGNIRELQHTIERGVILSDGIEIKTSDFSLIPNDKGNNLGNMESLNLHEIEKLLVKKAIEKHNGNISKAAQELGLTRAALYRRMEKFNI